MRKKLAFARLDAIEIVPFSLLKNILLWQISLKRYRCPLINT
ncbi:hypothetical protein DB42_DE00070 [Neochlamydia sp. EPS4]|nr:hypothetical protein DB42_DE00070 [Neochlamydia sp. EPS4]